eukprot:2769196-Prorocentrum_lima.AAC.1
MSLRLDVGRCGKRRRFDSGGGGGGGGTGPAAAGPGVAKAQRARVVNFQIRNDYGGWNYTP